jgi:hypothetical protein
MTLRASRQGSILALTGLGLWASCSVYDESLLGGGSPGGTGNGATGGAAAATGGAAGGTGGDSGGTAGSGGISTCVSVQPPTDPPTADPGPNDVEFVVAVRTIDFGEPLETETGTSDWRPLGYDLDKQCTFGGIGNSCSATPRNDFEDNTDDFEGGRDNALGKLIGGVARFIKGFGTPSYNERIANGQTSLLFRVSGYNGQPNDDQVELTVFTTDHLNALGGRSIPEWDGTDMWPIADSSLNGGEFNDPKYRDTRAFVKNGVIVGSLQVDLRLSIGITPTVLVEQVLSFVQAFFTAEVKQVDVAVGGDGGAVEGGTADGGTKKLWVFEKGNIAGRWKVNDLLHQLDQYPDPLVTTFQQPLCYNSGSYETFRDMVCSFVDIHSSLLPPTAPCDALSVGIGFEAVEAKLGQIFSLQPIRPRCPAQFSPAIDDCSKPYVKPTEAGTGDDAGDASSDVSVD